MIKEVHQVISGFTQSDAKGSGVEQLWGKIRRELIESGRISDSLVEISVWNANWAAKAEKYWRLSAGGELKVFIYAYSWGCGNGFVQLSKQLRKRGIGVEHAVLSDPVYRSGLIPSWFPNWLQIAPLSMTDLVGIKVPANVRRVDWYFQRQSRPQGNPPRLASSQTVLREGYEIQADHQYMDDRPEWHDRCLQVLKQVGD